MSATNDPGVGAFATLLGVRRAAMRDGSRFEIAITPTMAASP